MPKVKARDDRELKPFWTDGQSTYWHGDVIDVLARLPPLSVQCCVTSPPYWGLRDYSTGTWEGGDPACGHVKSTSPHTGITAAKEKYDGVKRNPENEQRGDTASTTQYTGICRKCGARRIDRQIGSEPLHDCLGWATGNRCGKCFVCKMVEFGRGVRRVLRDDGTFWLNLGDSYASGGGHTSQGANSQRKGRGNVGAQNAVGKVNTSGLPSGNLVGIPWRVALALQADGWILRSDVPWVKRSAMPESVRNRPAKALEYVFLLAKKPGYYFDMEAVRIRTGSETSPEEYASADGRFHAHADDGARGMMQAKPLGFKALTNPGGRAFRNADLWYETVDGAHGMTGVGDEIVGLDVTAEGYSGRHFATFPVGLVAPMIKAGTSVVGACADCGKAWVRVLDVARRPREKADGGGSHFGRAEPPGGGMNGQHHDCNVADVNTLGWRAACGCRGERFVSVGELALLEPGELEGVRPCIVADPFLGAGTTALACRNLGRDCWGIDLSEEYLRHHAIPRVAGDQAPDR